MPTVFSPCKQMARHHRQPHPIKQAVHESGETAGKEQEKNTGQTCPPFRKE
jgi:hypothetical protein